MYGIFSTFISGNAVEYTKIPIVGSASTGKNSGFILAIIAGEYCISPFSKNCERLVSNGCAKDNARMYSHTSLSVGIVPSLNCKF